MKKKLRVGVLMGGVSAEREISLVTGNAVCSMLDKNKYQVLPIEITREGYFLLDKEAEARLNVPESTISNKKISYLPQKIDLQNNAADRNNIDVLFIALHGTLGEDGSIQGMLECLGIPYTGSGVLASALAMHKDKAAEMYRAYDLLTPNFVVITRKEWTKNKNKILVHIKKAIGFPLVIKPNDQGSAVGVSIVRNGQDLEKTINQTITKFPNVLAQTFIKGQEATCGVLEKNGEPFALPPTHILPNFNEFYDYKSKYKNGGSTHVCPADFPVEINKKIQALALRAHQALGCKGMSRTDIFVGKDKQLWVIETNTIPGMTPTSLLPEAAAKAGISFFKMLDLIIQSALK